MTRLITRAALLAALLMSLFAVPALAHAELVSANPGPDDVIVGSPGELVAQFSQDLDASRMSMEVRDGSGSRVARGGEIGGGPREFRLALPPLTPGTYEVRYTTFSAEDSELHNGRYSFTVVAAPSPSPSPTPTPSPTPAASAPPTSPAVTASPSPTPTLGATPTPSPGATPTPSGGPGGGAGTSSDSSIVLPIVAVLAVVAGLGLWLMRRRTA